GVIGDSCRNNTSPGRFYDGSLPEQKSSFADVGTDGSRVSRLVHDFLRILVVGQSGQLNICWFRPYTTPNPESRLVWVRVLHNNASTPCFLVNFEGKACHRNGLGKLATRGRYVFRRDAIQLDLAPA